MSGDMVFLTVTAALLAVYAGSSLLLLLKPTLVHKKKRLAFHCRHISHRGGAGENLENTMAAFRHAADTCHTNMLEIDCQLTADGEVVVSHDDSLRRLAGHQNNISALAYKDLPDLLPSLPLDFNRDYHCKNCTDRKIPKLEDVFEEFKEIPINIDIKQDNEELIEKVAALISKYQREKITVWGNFQDKVCQKCYKKNPEIPLLFSMRRSLILMGLFYTGLLPFVPLKESCFELVMPSVFLDNPHHLFRPTSRQRLLLYILDKALMNKTLFRHLQKRGIHVYAWVLNSETEFDRAFRCGVDGVMTDFPSRLSTYLQEHSS